MVSDEQLLTAKYVERLAVGSHVFAGSIIELALEFKRLIIVGIIIYLNNVVVIKPAI